ncbi:hypothetical protein [Leifsonia sp. 22587]|uniref:hypothetical protein n=1 Tax=Leifsonia sp. 22587 TaxID=3453946 RepID=UPI003F843F34
MVAESKDARTRDAEAAEWETAPVSVRLLGRARTLVLWALGAAILYSSLRASKGSCPGGFDCDGGFVDASGQPTSVAPQCVQLELQPAPVVYLAIGLAVIIALTRAARAADIDAALRIMKRAAVVVVGIAVVSMLIAILWFQGMPMPTTTSTVVYPFPFGGGTTTVTPMEPGPTSG